MTLRKERPILDTIPELTRYTDDGCDLHPACLTCPLPRCRYDDPEERRNVVKELRDEAVVQAFRAGGQSAGELAELFGISKRTVHRILKADRERTVVVVVSSRQLAPTG